MAKFRDKREEDYLKCITNGKEIFITKDDLEKLFKTSVGKKILTLYTKPETLQFKINITKETMEKLIKNKKKALNLLKIADEKVKDKRAKVKRASYKEPSKYKKFNNFKNRKIEDWTSDDFLGYYLNLYVELEGKEDVDFISKSINWTKYRSIIKNFLEAKFNDDKATLLDYIETIMKWIKSDDTWTDGIISFNFLFNKNTPLIKQYMKLKNNNRKNRRKEDNDWGSNEKWLNKLNLRWEVT